MATEKALLGVQPVCPRCGNTLPWPELPPGGTMRQRLTAFLPVVCSACGWEGVATRAVPLAGPPGPS